MCPDSRMTSAHSFSSTKDLPSKAPLSHSTTLDHGTMVRHHVQHAAEAAAGYLGLVFGVRPLASRAHAKNVRSRDRVVCSIIF